MSAFFWPMSAIWAILEQLYSETAAESPFHYKIYCTHAQSFSPMFKKAAFEGIVQNTTSYS
jgi:hypothetical protein